MAVGTGPAFRNTRAVVAWAVESCVPEMSLPAIKRRTLPPVKWLAQGAQHSGR
jgi:hypothetical protein